MLIVLSVILVVSTLFPAINGVKLTEDLFAGSAAAVLVAGCRRSASCGLR
jgi:hypothetical protein